MFTPGSKIGTAVKKNVRRPKGYAPLQLGCTESLSLRSCSGHVLRNPPSSELNAVPGAKLLHMDTVNAHTLEAGVNLQPNIDFDRFIVVNAFYLKAE